MAFNLSNFGKRAKMYRGRNLGQRGEGHTFVYEMRNFQQSPEEDVRNINENVNNFGYNVHRQSDRPHTDNITFQSFETKAPNNKGLRNLDSDLERQNVYHSNRIYKSEGNFRSSSHDRNTKSQNDFDRSINANFYRDSGQPINRESDRKRSDYPNGEMNTARERYHGKKQNLRDYDPLDDAGEVAETGFDEPIPDYGEDDNKLHNEFKQRDVYVRDAPSDSKMHRNQGEIREKGRDNPAFTYDDWEIRRYETERRSFKDQRNTEYEITNPDRYRIQRERNTKHEHARGESESSGDESFTLERQRSQGLRARRRLGHRATIASPRDIHVSTHYAVETIQRRKTEKRTKSNLLDDRNSIFRETDNDENKLPSNRHTRTKSLKQRIEALHNYKDVPAHLFAESLRDQILPKTQKKLGLLDIWKYQLAMVGNTG